MRSLYILIDIYNDLMVCTCRQIALNSSYSVLQTRKYLGNGPMSNENEFTSLQDGDGCPKQIHGIKNKK